MVFFSEKVIPSSVQNLSSCFVERGNVKPGRFCKPGSTQLSLGTHWRLHWNYIASEGAFLVLPCSLLPNPNS